VSKWTQIYKMNKSKQFLCIRCNYNFASKQNLLYHIEHNSCANKVVLNKFKNIRLKKPINHIGFDIDEPKYYDNYLISHNIELKLPKTINVMHLVDLFKRIHRIPEYGSPIENLVRKNEPYESSGSYDIYNYYDSRGRLIQNEDTDDLIVCIYSQLLWCFTTRVDQLVLKLMTERQEDFLDKRADIRDLIRHYVDVQLVRNQDRLKRDIDLYWGEGTFKEKINPHYFDNEIDTDEEEHDRNIRFSNELNHKQNQIHKSFALSKQLAHQRDLKGKNETISNITTSSTISNITTSSTNLKGTLIDLYEPIFYLNNDMDPFIIINHDCLNVDECIDLQYQCSKLHYSSDIEMKDFNSKTNIDRFKHIILHLSNI
jgi:hypothetical protein